MQKPSKFFQRLRTFFHAYKYAYGYTCDCCGAEIFDYPARRVCAECESELDYNRGRVCPKCGRKTVAAGVCLTCKIKPPAFTAGVCAFVYRGMAASLVNRLKNGNARPALFLGERTADAFLERFPAVKTQFPIPVYEMNAKRLLVLPVPCTRDKRKERGHNQAEALADVLVERLQKRGVATELMTDVLYKRRETAQQKHLGTKGRLKNVSGVYHLHKRTVCKDRTVLLVDDILTTGATGSSIASLLVKAGAKAVYFVAAAGVAEQIGL